MPKGSPHGHFQTAVERGNVLAAIAAARELGRLQLGDALSLVFLFADKAPERFDRAAAQWHARFVLEADGVGLAESELIRAALAELRGPGRSAAGEVLAEIGRRRRLLGVEQAARAYVARAG